MGDSNSQIIIDKISKNLINSQFSSRGIGENKGEVSDRDFMFEQYKLLIDSAHRIEERRGGSDNIFIGINTVIVSVLISSDNLTINDIFRLPLGVSLVIIGLSIAWNWLRVITAYKKLNFLNYSLIEAFEVLLPTRVFSLRAKMEAEEDDQHKKNRANIILNKESLLPKAFLLIYVLSLVNMLIKCIV